MFIASLLVIPVGAKNTFGINLPRMFRQKPNFSQIHHEYYPSATLILFTTFMIPFVPSRLRCLRPEPAVRCVFCIILVSRTAVSLG